MIILLRFTSADSTDGHCLQVFVKCYVKLFTQHSPSVCHNPYFGVFQFFLVHEYCSALTIYMRIFSVTCCVQTYKSPKEVGLHVESSTSAAGRSTPRSARPGYSHSQQPAGHRRPPWKGSDRTPQDTWRLNYLDNDDEIEKVNKLSVLFIGNGCRDCSI